MNTAATMPTPIPTPSPATEEGRTVERRNFGGIEFEAVRMMRPLPHWRARLVATGYLFAAGVFRSQTRAQLWESIADTCRRRGEYWIADSLTAHADEPHRPGARPFVLWGYHPGEGYATEPIKLADYSRNAVVRYTREGWQCEACEPGQAPRALPVVL